MNPRNKDISIRVLYGEEEFLLETYAGEYRNLMLLLYDKIYLADFGDCRGMGRCGTCMIEIIDSKKKLPSLERNEDATIEKSGITDENVRLSCQILVNEELNNAVIRIYL